MLDRVIGYIRRNRLLKAGDRVAVAVSGGGDSVALLALLEELRVRLGITLAVAHFNHRLRGAESDEDERFVRQLAAGRGLECLIEHSRHPSPGARNLEAHARRERYEFLASLKMKVATAHTADDQAETVMARFLRGAGPAGLAGIYPLRDGWLIRPLLEERRAELRTWAAARGLLWREDTSNQNPRFLRNRVRAELLPMLESKYNPGLVDVLTGVAAVARAEEEFWQSHTEKLAAVLQPSGLGGWKLLLADFVQYYEAEQRRLLREALRRTRGHLRGVDFRHIEQARRLALEAQSGRGIDLPGCHVERALDGLVFCGTRGAPRGEALPFEMPVEVPGSCEIPQIGLRLLFKLVQETRGGAGYNQERGQDLIALDAIRQPLVVRNWRPGDCWETSPGHRRKLKSLMLERRIPRQDRRSWPVVVGGDGLIWARGFPTPPSCRWSQGMGLWIVEEELANG